MPIYEYRCQTCSKVFELLVRGAAAEGPTCPECGGEELKRLFSLFASRSESAAASAPAATMRQGGGGCCGGGCGCH
jgi:putative FmdB family regulatory protein